MKKIIKKILGTSYQPLRKCFYGIQRVISIACFYITGKYFTNQKKLKKLKNLYSGKRCFVICNGPSLEAKDLTKIYENGDISIGMNAIPRIYDKTPWRPTILSATDDTVYDSKNYELIKNCDADIKLYDRTRYLKSLGAKGNLLYLSFDESPKLLDYPHFGIDATKKLPSIGTSAYSLIEFAVFLGCKEIYILGCDMSYAVNLHRDGSITYNESGMDHFYKANVDNFLTNKTTPAPIWQLETAFSYIAKYAKENGLKIYNATRGGKLEYFERVNFDDLFDNEKEKNNSTIEESNL